MIGKTVVPRIGSTVVKVVLVAVVAVLLLGGPGIGHAMTVDSINLNVTAGQYSASSTSLGVFNQNLSDGGQVQLGSPPTTWGVQASQNTDIENSNGVLTIAGYGGISGGTTWDTGGSNAQSTLSIQFTTVTGGTYSINGSNYPVLQLQENYISLWDVTNGTTLAFTPGAGGQVNSSGTLVSGQTYELDVGIAGVALPGYSGYGTLPPLGGWNVDFTATDAGSPVPLPPSLFLLGSGVVGALTARRKLKR